MEYCGQMWNSHFLKDIELIQGVEWGIWSIYLCYSDILKHFELTHLDRRRIRNDAVETLKIINSVYSIRDCFWLWWRWQTNFKRSRLNIRTFAFANRVVEKWTYFLTVLWLTTLSHISIELESDTRNAINFVILESRPYLVKARACLCHQWNTVRY